MAARATLAAKALSDGLAIFGFKVSQTDVEHFPPRHDDHVEARRDLVSTENFSNQSFSSVSLDRAPQFPGGRDAEPAEFPVAGKDKNREAAPAYADAARVDQLEFGAPANPLARPKTSHREALLVADRQALPPLGAPTLQHEASVLGGHTHEKAVCACPTAPVRLECPFTLHEIPSTQAAKARLTNRQCYRRRSESVNASGFVLESVLRSARFHRTSGMRVWSLPKVFHTCGKNCGNVRFPEAKLQQTLWFSHP